MCARAGPVSLSGQARAGQGQGVAAGPIVRGTACPIARRSLIAAAAAVRAVWRPGGRPNGRPGGRADGVGRSVGRAVGRSGGRAVGRSAGQPPHDKGRAAGMPEHALPGEGSKAEPSSSPQAKAAIRT